jgi:pimeloyl-[acyl-carrier protein] methyl ester esterase
MNNRVEIILQHGWAFDRSCWRGWLPHLKENADWELHIQTPDRGYFGEAREVLPFTADESIKVVVAHSLGLHLLPEEVLSKAHLLVLAGSFAHFHDGEPLQQKRSRRTINMMLNKLSESPLDVISEFYSNCYHPLLTSQMLLMRDIKTVNSEVLIKDLELLNSNRFDTSLIEKQKVLFVHGNEDIIVPLAHSQEISKSLKNSSLVVFEGAGHSLPLTHVAPVWISMRNSLRRLLTVNA